MEVKRQEANVEAAVEAKGLQVTVTQVSDFQEIAKLGIFSAPATVIDEQVQCVGRVPKQSEIKAWIS
ncbi:MAG: thioredoxin family protein [Desulfobulbus sp.]